jgi:hypothetical protein
MSRAKDIVVASGAVAAIIGSGVWIYLTQFSQPTFNVVLHEHVGEILAQETAKLIQSNGQVVIVTMDSSKVPELRIQRQAFEKALKTLGPMTIKELPMETEDKPQYRTGAGLSSRRLLRIVKKSAKAKAIVSFIGAPRMTEEELAQMETAPKFVAECRSPDKIKKLFEKNILQVAVINRFDYPAPIKHNPKTPKQWFEKYYQVVTAANASDLPKNAAE